jgi:hypothetical protein
MRTAHPFPGQTRKKQSGANITAASLWLMEFEPFAARVPKLGNKFGPTSETYTTREMNSNRQWRNLTAQRHG